MEAADAAVRRKARQCIMEGVLGEWGVGMQVLSLRNGHASYV
jgi:hypothetical protein